MGEDPKDEMAGAGGRDGSSQEGGWRRVRCSAIREELGLELPLLFLDRSQLWFGHLVRTGGGETVDRQDHRGVGD